MMYIDEIARQWGVEFFGEKAMERITPPQIEAARVWAFRELSDITFLYGRQPAGTLQELFCNRLFSEYI